MRTSSRAVTGDEAMSRAANTGSSTNSGVDHGSERRTLGRLAALIAAAALLVTACGATVGGSPSRGAAESACVAGGSTQNCSAPTTSGAQGTKSVTAADGAEPTDQAQASDSATAPQSVTAPTSTRPSSAATTPESVTTSGALPTLHTDRTRPTQPTHEPSPGGPTLNSTRVVTPSSAVTGTASTATVDAHSIITVHGPGTSKLVLDIYEDPLCPICGQFEAMFGEQIRQAVAAGELTVRYRFVTFLDPGSASGDYSTRAYAALLALTQKAGDQPGLVMRFHGRLFDPDVQPKEGGSADLTDRDLADLAEQIGAPHDAVSAIADGSQHDLATSGAAANLKELGRVSPMPGTPTVVKDDKPVDITTTGWLDTLLGG